MADSIPYAGEQLVSDESYLRRLPVALTVKERLRFDAIVTAADIITQAFNLLRQCTADAGIDLEKFTNGLRAFALGQCWTIVDQLHAIRQLLPVGKKQPGQFSKALIDAAEPATLLRNRMDHLAGNLENLSKLKGYKPPLFGSLSYVFWADPENTPDQMHIVAIMSGALQGADIMPFVNPGERQCTLPTGLFTLSAFEYELEFGSVLGRLRDWLRRVESTIEADIRAEVVKRAPSDKEVEAGMATLGGGLTMILEVGFGEHNETESGA